MCVTCLFLSVSCPTSPLFPSSQPCSVASLCGRGEYRYYTRSFLINCVFWTQCNICGIYSVWVIDSCASSHVVRSPSPGTRTETEWPLLESCGVGVTGWCWCLWRQNWTGPWAQPLNLFVIMLLIEIIFFVPRFFLVQFFSIYTLKTRQLFI